MTRSTLHAARLAAALLSLVMLQAPAQTPPPDPADPHGWLEDVLGERPLAWVRERSRATETLLQAEPGFDALRSALREVLDSREQIPAVSRIGAHLYNLWRDADNPRGLWRRTTLDEYRKPQPAWETVLDLDALGRAEGESWVWSGATCLGPTYRRCLVQLSRGGADAHVTREFDLVDKRFVPAEAGGFALPEAKSQVEWEDADTVYVATDFGPGSLTESGYPRVIKRWGRGQPLAQARTVFEARVQDVYAWVSVDRTPGFERTLFARAPGFFDTEVSLQDGDRLRVLDKPLDAQLSFWRQHVLLQLRSDWTVGGRTWPQGALLVTEADAYLRGERRFTALFTPTATRSLESFTATRSTLLLTVNDNVASRLQEWRLQAGTAGADGPAWTARDVQAPYPGTLSAAALHDPLLGDDPLAEQYLLSATDFLQPDTLQLGRTGSDAREVLKSRPAYFDAAGMRVEQHFAISRDGTRVPYFVVWPRGARAGDGGEDQRPALLYGYGGFEVSMQPGYSGLRGRAWLARGGVFVLANIRGGGEFGPAWHQAALQQHRQRSFDDFIAVAEDLAARRITRPARLGIMGGSNGGLLVGAVMLQRPDLFGAVVCQVPLLDMQRYHRLLAGASWMDEYGNPDDPAQWQHMRRWSPYQVLQDLPAATRLPPVLFTTSTRDDRVHPGHARKMAAALQARGAPVLYWENTEGGHGGAADNAQRAQMAALEYAFLWRTLGGR